MIGQTLSHFRILAKIGEGGMGVVYRAEDTKLRRQVALKVLPPELVSNEERRLRFLREARAAAAVTHPNIATVHEIDEADGVVFIAMELVEGKTLRKLIGGRPMLIKNALRVATEMAEGLARAHEAGVVHRDLKPDNVIVGSDGHPKILDFGLAKLRHVPSESSEKSLTQTSTVTASLTQEGKILGTISYMSPEQARGRESGTGSDLFSFGIILYEMVTGRLPFRGESNTDTLSAILRDEPISPSQLNPQVPKGFERIIRQCLEKNPESRYQNAGQVAADLGDEQYLRVPHRPWFRKSTARTQTRASIPATKRTVSPSRRAGTLLGLGFALVTGAAITWWITRPPAGFETGDRIIVAGFATNPGEPELAASVRDAFENMMSGSGHMTVIGGERLNSLLQAQDASIGSVMDPGAVRMLCEQDGCEGYLTGSVSRDGAAYTLGARLYRFGREEPVATVSEQVTDEKDMLEAIRAMVIGIRLQGGESEQQVAPLTHPTTQSLAAYQAYAAASQKFSPEESLPLYQRALRIDPEFVDARWSLANMMWNLGDLEGYRREIATVYKDRAALSEENQFRVEIDYFDAMYQFDLEIERLRVAASLYPRKSWPREALCLLHPHGYGSLERAVVACREAYEISPNAINLLNLCETLTPTGAADEIDRTIADYEKRNGKDVWARSQRILSHMIRGENEKIEEELSNLDGAPAGLRSWATHVSMNWLLASGQLNEAWNRASLSRSAFGEASTGEADYSAKFAQLWLAARRGDNSRELIKATTDPIKNDLRMLSLFAILADELRLEVPLLELLREHERQGTVSALVEQDTSDSLQVWRKSRYVEEELVFARATLDLVQGEAGAASKTFEALARTSELPARHRMLARAYESLGSWKRAADEYELVLRNPHLKWSVWVYPVPAMQVLDEYRLAGIYERLDNPDRARHWYERFLTDWKDADPNIPELIEAKKRMAALGETELAGVR